MTAVQENNSILSKENYPQPRESKEQHLTGSEGERGVQQHEAILSFRETVQERPTDEHSHSGIEQTCPMLSRQRAQEHVSCCLGRECRNM